MLEFAQDANCEFQLTALEMLWNSNDDGQKDNRGAVREHLIKIAQTADPRKQEKALALLLQSTELQDRQAAVITGAQANSLTGIENQIVLTLLKMTREMLSAP